MTESLPALDRQLLTASDAALVRLPEKAVQFGTGAFLRGFVDAYLDSANRRGRFNGRVVAIGSTGSGRHDLLRRQEGLFTLAVQGVEHGVPQRRYERILSVSRAVSAVDDWSAVLACAHDPQLELVFSNTTEIGIELDEDDRFDAVPPRSFPGKLTRFLYERARAFDFAVAKGVVVIPCELVDGNGDRLREIVTVLARHWNLGVPFTDWIARAVPFCNTLVDRIVPGAPPAHERERMWREIGYRDELLTVCEPYHLFAIECTEPVRRRLTFAEGDDSIVLTGDVGPYRERKIRLLNGTHTMLAPVGLLAGLETVRDAMCDELVGRFARRALLEEILPTVDALDAGAFALEVLDRFSNPFIRHALIDIMLQATTKMRERVVPSIVRAGARTGRAPQALALGFAAYLLFMRGDAQQARIRAGLRVPPDTRSERVRVRWESHADGGREALASLAADVCGDVDLWGVDLRRVAGFPDAVTEHLVRVHDQGVGAALATLRDAGVNA